MKKVKVKDNKPKIKDFDEIYVNRLSYKDEMFVEFYCGIDKGNGITAARRAGFSAKTAGVTASQLLKNPMIKLAIQKKRERQKALAELKEQDILQELGKIIKADPRRLYHPRKGTLKKPQELSDEEAAIIIGVEEHINEKGEVIRKYRITDREKAIIDYGKQIGMFVEQHKELTPTDFNLTIIKKDET